MSEVVVIGLVMDIVQSELESSGSGDCCGARKNTCEQAMKRMNGMALWESENVAVWWPWRWSSNRWSNWRYYGGKSLMAVWMVVKCRDEVNGEKERWKKSRVTLFYSRSPKLILKVLGSFWSIQENKINKGGFLINKIQSYCYSFFLSSDHMQR